MSDDLAQLLRRLCDRFYGFPDVTTDLAAAADRIEALEAGVARLEETIADLNARST